MPRMRRGEVILSCVFVSLVACGGGGNSADAPPLEHEVDADTRPDAFVCTLTECGSECVDLTSDEAHCGDCDTACDAGASCIDSGCVCAPPNTECPDACTNTDTDPLHCGDCDTACPSGASCVDAGCVCPPNFIPGDLSGNPTGQDMVLDQLPGAYVAITPYFSTGINGFGVGYSTTDVTIGAPGYDLDGSTLPATPFAIALYNIDIATMMPEAAFAAISGHLRFDIACDTGASGRLTNATFQAATIFPSPMVDPNGCTFTLTSVDFSIGDPASCPPAAN
jgi:hypothetical protein